MKRAPVGRGIKGAVGCTSIAPVGRGAVVVAVEPTSLAFPLAFAARLRRDLDKWRQEATQNAYAASEKTDLLKKLHFVNSRSFPGGFGFEAFTVVAGCLRTGAADGMKRSVSSWQCGQLMDSPAISAGNAICPLQCRQLHFDSLLMPFLS